MARRNWPKSIPSEQAIAHLLFRAADFCDLCTDDPMLKKAAQRDAGNTAAECRAAAESLHNAAMTRAKL